MIKLREDFIEYINMSLMIFSNSKITNIELKKIMPDFIEESKGLSEDLQKTINVMEEALNSGDINKLDKMFEDSEKYLN